MTIAVVILVVGLVVAVVATIGWAAFTLLTSARWPELLLSAIGLVVLVIAVAWLVRQGPPKDGEALPDNKTETHLGGTH